MVNILTRNLKVAGQLGGEGLCEIGDGGVEVQDGGVLQALGLIDDGVHHIGMAVPAANRSDPAESVHVSPPFLIEQVLPLPRYNVQLSKPPPSPTIKKKNWNINYNLTRIYRHTHTEKLTQEKTRSLIIMLKG